MNKPEEYGQSGSDAGGGCPFCGADILFCGELTDYKCGSRNLYGKKFIRSDDCFMAEIAQLKETIKANKIYYATLLKDREERLDAWRVSKVGWDEYWQTLEDEPEIKRLKDLGEI